MFCRNELFKGLLSQVKRNVVILNVERVLQWRTVQWPRWNDHSEFLAIHWSSIRIFCCCYVYLKNVCSIISGLQNLLRCPRYYMGYLHRKRSQQWIFDFLKRIYMKNREMFLFIFFSPPNNADRSSLSSSVPAPFSFSLVVAWGKFADELGQISSSWSLWKPVCDMFERLTGSMVGVALPRG